MEQDSRNVQLWAEWGWRVAKTVLMRFMGRMGMDRSALICTMGRMGMEGGQDSPDALYGQNGDGQVSPDLLYGQNEDGGWPGQS